MSPRVFVLLYLFIERLIGTIRTILIVNSFSFAIHTFSNWLCCFFYNSRNIDFLAVYMHLSDSRNFIWEKIKITICVFLMIDLVALCQHKNNSCKRIMRIMTKIIGIWKLLVAINKKNYVLFYYYYYYKSI